MRKSRIPLAYLITLSIIICALVVGPVTSAQDKSCETPPAPMSNTGTTRTPARGSALGRTPQKDPPKPDWGISGNAPTGRRSGPILWGSEQPLIIPPVPGANPTIVTAPDPPTTNSPIYEPPGVGEALSSRWGGDYRVSRVEAAAGYDVVASAFGYCANLLESRKEVTRAKFRAGGRSISVVQFTGAKPLPYSPDRIYIHDSNAPASIRTPRALSGSVAWLNKLVEVTKPFLEDLGAGAENDPALRDARFITAVKAGADEYVTIYQFGEGGLRGVTLNLRARPQNCHAPGCTFADLFYAIIGPWLEPIAGRGRLYVVGNDLEGLDPTAISSRFNLDVIRRSARTRRSIRDTELRLAELQGRKLEAGRTVYVNGLPRDRAEAVRAGYQQNQLRELQDAAKEMDKVAKKFLGKKLSALPPQGLRELLAAGDADVVLIVAHSNSERIYVNGTPVSVEEIKSYPDRQTPSRRPRVCVLLSCYAGDLGAEKGWWLFRRNVDSLAELFVRKGYFDKVIAPKGEVTPTEVTLILRDYFSGRLIREIAARRHRQLLQIAEARTKNKPRPASHGS
jgi:hypothetical protein